VIEGCFDVLGGSMGAVHGERVVRAYRRATEERLPVVVLTSSGGARMQEGMVSLIQMARTASAARAHAAAGLLSVAVYRPPTTGGVYASYGSLVDLRAAQPGATLGFAGPRVVEQTLGGRLAEGEHTAESAYSAGIVDALVPEAEQAAWVEACLGLRELPLASRRLEGRGPRAPAPEPASATPAWEEVQRARAPERRTGIDHAARLCSSWVELRCADPTVRSGLSSVAGRRAVVIALDRHAGSGRPRPAGYRLARRAIALAGRLGLPLLTLVDTPGAEPGPEAESGGIALEIALTFAAMGELPTVSVALCVGEGGSGGALALAHADRLIMLDHAVFSVIAPEGAAAILARDAAQAPLLAERLRLTARDQVDLGIADAVVAEDDRAVAQAVASALAEARPGDRLRRADAATARALR
jgi:acetyl-CoA carboxylase carboxyl transferase subunit beta